MKIKVNLANHRTRNTISQYLSVYVFHSFENEHHFEFESMKNEFFDLANLCIAHRNHPKNEIYTLFYSKRQRGAKRLAMRALHVAGVIHCLDSLCTYRGCIPSIMHANIPTGHSHLE